MNCKDTRVGSPQKDTSEPAIQSNVERLFILKRWKCISTARKSISGLSESVLCREVNSIVQCPLIEVPLVTTQFNQ